MRAYLVLILLLLLLNQCQSAQVSQQYDSALYDQCQNLATAFREEITQSKVNNAGFPPVADAQFLHSSRFYDQMAQQVENDLQAQELLSILAELGDQIRQGENRNLRQSWGSDQLEAISSCSNAIATDLNNSELRSSLIENLRSKPTINDHYNGIARALGLYPLLRPVFKWRIDLLHSEEKQVFNSATDFRSPVSYAIEKDTSLTESLSPLSRAYSNSPLKLPQLSESELAGLFQRYAPALQIETLGSQDRIGSPKIQDINVSINTDEVVAYTLPSYTRFAGRNLLQLNYVFWFPAREPRAWIDLYAGKFDSLIWRVTLSPDGEILLYDSIHSCGCYHKFFIASDAVTIKEAPDSAEPANIFSLSSLQHIEGLKLSVSDNEHFIVDASNDGASATTTYKLAAYNSLYNLPASAGSRSLFDHHGIIAGSERLERFTLWPTGISNVGAMRQWGTHAVGFVERQHFDDAQLFDRYFELRAQ